MNFAFLLSMPGNNAWDGKWTGEGTLYARVKTFSARDFKATGLSLVGHHRYNFGDGWVASVEVKVVDSTTKRKLVKQSKGFCGYDWMIDSLMAHGEIRA
jgi:hypothetical protein